MIASYGDVSIILALEMEVGKSGIQGHSWLLMNSGPVWAETLPHKIKISMTYSQIIIYCGITIDFKLRKGDDKIFWPKEFESRLLIEYLQRKSTHPPWQSPWLICFFVVFCLEGDGWTHAEHVAPQGAWEPEGQVIRTAFFHKFANVGSKCWWCLTAYFAITHHDDCCLMALSHLALMTVNFWHLKDKPWFLCASSTHG